MTNATATSSLRATDVSADTSCAYLDGVSIALRVTYVAGDPSVNYPASIEWEPIGSPRLDSRVEWDAAHPGVEPTLANMQALVDSADEAIQEDVEEAFDRRDDGWAPDDDYSVDDVEVLS